MIQKKIKTEFLARYSRDRKRKQKLLKHLKEVSEILANNASKIGLKTLGQYLGFNHDLGKYSHEFQEYLAIGDKTQRGTVNHSTAGAQRIYEKISNDKKYDFLKELLALCNMSHHTNLIDMLTLQGEDNFGRRLKEDIPEFRGNVEEEIEKEISEIDENEMLAELQNIKEKIDENKGSISKKFYLGMLAKFLLSCLIDADHTNSADFESGKESGLEKNNQYEKWGIVSERLDASIKKLTIENNSADSIKNIRKKISDECYNSGQTLKKGCYKLEVPTGGGKTLASFRFAIEMAIQHKADRIIYCMPYTTIIEQNADVIRKIVEIKEEEKGKIILEHHSNLSQKNKTEEEIDLNEILMENWDVPIVFTTNVQILEILFGSKTTSTRRLHQLANSIIIFDEIQTLPIKCIHLFNNAINFLVDICGATVVLCTATQPLLDRANEKDFKFGNLKISKDKSIIHNVKEVFDSLKRVEVICEDLNDIKDVAFIGNEAIKLANKNNNCLVVCNTTKSAKEIFEYVFNKGKNKYKIYHLSARMMPIHRKWILRCIKQDLNPKNKTKLIVVSTQVIEAGVDIDFNSGIRALAGLDSILQTAGRINRNGLNGIKNLYVYRFSDNSDNIEYIRTSAKTTYNIIRQYPDIAISDIKMIDKYYDDLYFHFQKQMKYLSKNIGDSLLNLLSCNSNNPNSSINYTLRQSFSTAYSEFKAIDNVTTPVIVDKGRSRRIINNFSKVYDPKEKKRLIRELNKYSINIYETQKRNLCGAIHKISNDLEIFYIDEVHYNNNFGIIEEYTIKNGGIC
ncbi:MAG: CRISPR-associated helicase Cas3' [Rickettsiales bacterium]|jgi:CRISPR-associated endonuclease/helicase Cas3|nr:CRISPR-associated helicase Cas3' [Rickettsiales bacterium]